MVHEMLCMSDTEYYGSLNSRIYLLLLSPMSALEEQMIDSVDCGIAEE